MSARTIFATLAIGIVFTACFLGPLWLAKAFGHVPGCHSRRCDQRIHHKRRVHWMRVHIWDFRLHHLTAWENTWVRCIADHETRGIPWSRKARVATGNGYFGATQFLPATWHSAGGSGLPTDHSLSEQLVRTVRWAHTAGSSQWSTSTACGSV